MDRKRVVVTAAVGLVVVLAAGLFVALLRGGDDGPPPEVVWAEQACTEVAEWREELRDLIGDVGVADVVLRGGDTLQQLLIDGAIATGALANDLRRLGLPESEGVEAARAEVDQFLDELDELREVAEEAVTEINGPGDLIDVARTLVTDVRAAAGEARESFTALRESDALGDLRRGFDEADACRNLDLTV
jgi:hypothetical protein